MGGLLHTSLKTNYYSEKNNTLFIDDFMSSNIWLFNAIK
jgi:hypothetical protein